MAEIVIGLLGPAIELGKFIVAPIKRQLIYLCCFNTNVLSLIEEAKKLEDERAGLQTEVDTEIYNAQVIDSKVETWLKKVNKIQQEMSVLETEITNAKGVKSRYSVSRRVVKTAEAMKQKREDRHDITVISHRPPPASTMPDILVRSACEFESRKKIEEDMMTNLKDENVEIMGLCGMGGVGKTTLAEQIKNKVMKENVYGESVMVVVSQPAEKLKIQGEIAEKLGLRLEEASLSGRAERLCTRLMGGKRILVILDDIWELLDLKELGIPCKSGPGGCTVLLTSRDKSVLERMEAKPILEMQILNGEEALSFFKEILYTSAVDQNDQLSSLAEKIARECKGLPLALATVARVLKGKMEIYVWEDALRDLTRSSPEDLQDVLRGVYSPLKLSYEYLSSQNAKSLFLLCCLFPEDFNILIEDLCSYAMGLCMFGEIRDFKQVRDKTCSLIEMLKSRFLLLKGKDERYVKMHDVVRDVAIFIASKEKRLIKCGDKSTWISSFIGERIELPNESTFPNLHLLMIKDLHIGDVSFEGMKGLNVLSISCGNPFQSLPQTTQFLKSLHTLILENCEFLRSMCPVGELLNLEILICRGCNAIEELPAKTMRLRCLRMLEISRCQALQKIRPGVISSLDKLEVLKIVDCFNNWEAESKERENENASLSELEYLSNLTHLEIDVKDSNLAAQQISLPPKIEKYYISINSFFYSRRIEFGKVMRLQTEITLGKWIQECVESVECLNLKGNGSNNLDLSKAQNLRWLRFADCSTATSVVRCGATHVVFPLLECMQLENLINLEEICDIYDVPNLDVSSNDLFKNLKDLRLERLPALKRLWKTSLRTVSLYNNLSSITVYRCERILNLFSLSTARDCFPQLERLRITECRDMEKVFSWKEDEDEEKNNGQESGHHIPVTFPKMKCLELWDLPNLKVFCQGIENIEFPLLTKIYIRRCPQLKVVVPNTRGICIGHSPRVLCKQKDENINSTLGPQIPMGSFTHLEELTIRRECGSIKSLFSLSMAQNLERLRVLSVEYCEKMEKVIEEEGPDCSSTLVFPHLVELYLVDLPKLKTFCNSAVGFPKLVRVYINVCPEMCGFNLGSPMESLERLEIWDCWMMEQVFLWSTEGIGQSNQNHRHISFPKLAKLDLRKLPRLTSFYRGIESLEFHLLTKMDIYDCPNLKSLVSTTTSGDISNIEVLLKQSKEQPPLWDRIPERSFARLKKLSIYGFDKISTLFSSSVVIALSNLKFLCIGSCKNMVKVIEEEVVECSNDQTTLLFPQLEDLGFVDLPELMIFCEWRCSLELPSLKNVLILRCPKMERFSLGSLTTSNLKTIEIEDREINIAGDLNDVLQQILKETKTSSEGSHSTQPQGQM